jgi:hypothetical protein
MSLESSADAQWEKLSNKFNQMKAAQHQWDLLLWGLGSLVLWISYEWIFASCIERNHVGAAIVGKIRSLKHLFPAPFRFPSRSSVTSLPCL